MVVRIRLRVDDRSIGSILNQKDVVPLSVARPDGSVDGMMRAGLVVFKTFRLFLKMLHLSISGHPFSMELSGFLQFLVVGARLESVPDSLGVDPVENIIDEARFLGRCRLWSHDAGQERDEQKATDHCPASKHDCP